MKDLFQIGEFEWIDPEEVSGIVWDHAGNCRFPLVLLKGGHSVPADRYKTPARSGEDARKAAIRSLKSDLEATSWAKKD